MKIKILSLIFAVTMLISSNVFAANAFSDVSISHWASHYIYGAHALNIINGFPDGTYKPENQLKTGEFIKMVAMAMYPNYEYKAPEPDEADGTHWSKPYVLLLGRFFIDVTKYDDARMERTITREEAAELVCKLYIQKRSGVKLGEEGKNIKNLVDESEITDELSRKYIDNCMEFGIIEGFPDKTFRPKEGLTRAQAAKIIYTALFN